MDAVLFDFDGLIVDTEWPAFVTAVEVFEAHGVGLTLGQWQHRLGRGDNRPWTDLLADALGRAVDHDRITEQRRVRKDDLTDAQPLLPGVTRLLDIADGLGLRTGVASSSSMGWVGRHLEMRGILDRFACVSTSDDVDRTKPWPDVFLAAADALDADPDRTIVFEDSVHGVTAAKAAGMACVAVPNRVTAGGDFSHADLVVESLVEIDLVALVDANRSLSAD